MDFSVLLMPGTGEYQELCRMKIGMQTVYPITEVRAQKTEWFVAFGEIICCWVWLVLFTV
jgi:hypothetical protein